MPHRFAVWRTASRCSDRYPHLSSFSAAQDARWSSHQADLEICLFYQIPPERQAKSICAIIHGLGVYHYLEVSQKLSCQEPLPLSACLHMHAYAMLEGGRTSTVSSLGRESRGPLRQAYLVSVCLWAAVVPDADLYCTGRWFKLECKLRFASVRSSDEFVVRVSPRTPKPVRWCFPRVCSQCDAKGRDSLLEFYAHRWVACMHALWHVLVIHG